MATQVNIVIVTVAFLVGVAIGYHGTIWMVTPLLDAALAECAVR